MTVLDQLFLCPFVEFLDRRERPEVEFLEVFYRRLVDLGVLGHLVWRTEIICTVAEHFAHVPESVVAVEWLLSDFSISFEITSPGQLGSRHPSNCCMEIS